MAAMTAQTITLRLIIEDPLSGVTYSLQNASSAPVNATTATDAPLTFDVPVQVARGPSFRGEFVRREGKERRFIYIAVGAQAGDAASPWSRRMKVDIHNLPANLLEQALAGEVVLAMLAGRAKDGGPACGTVRPLAGWQAAT